MPRLCLIDQWGPCPPDGFRYVFPTDGWVCHAWTYVDWVQAAKDHLYANGEPVPDSLAQDMEEQLCLTLPPGWCNYDDPNRPRVSTSMDWNAIQNGVSTMARWVEGGMQFVVKEEAERRALICSRCYLNVNVTGCAACHAAVAQLVRGVSTKYDFALKACAACKCLLRAKVHFPMEVLDKENAAVQQLYPDHCWLKQGGINYGG